MKKIGFILFVSISLAACNNTNPQNIDVGEINQNATINAWSENHSNQTNKYSIAQPLAAQRGITSGESIQVKAALTLNDGAYLYATKGYAIQSKALTLNGNRVQSAIGAKTCLDNSGNNVCTNGKPTEQIRPLKTVLAPDIKGIRTTLTPSTFDLIVRGSLRVKTAKQWADLTAQKNVRILGELSVEVPATLNNTLIVEGEINFKAGLALTDSVLIGKSLKINNGLSISGASTILARDEISIRGDFAGTRNTDSKNLAQIIGGSEIEIKGTGAGTLAAVIWSGDTVELSGTNNLFGGVLASESIKINGDTSVGVLDPNGTLITNLGANGLEALLDGTDQAAAVDLFNEYGINYTPKTTTRVQTRAVDTTSNTNIETYCGKRFASSLFKSYQTPASGGSYYIEAAGRPGSVEFTAKNTNGIADDACRLAVGNYGVVPANYQGGHMWGNQLGGYTKRLNLAPQISGFNTGNWRVAETSVKVCATRGIVAKVFVRVEYTDTTETPSTWTMNVTIGTNNIVRTFQNATAGGPSGLQSQQDITAFVRGLGCL
jgi:DNA/RNA non-specific endonuclease